MLPFDINTASAVINYFLIIPLAIYSLYIAEGGVVVFSSIWVPTTNNVKEG